MLGVYLLFSFAQTNRKHKYALLISATLRARKQCNNGQNRHNNKDVHRQFLHEVKLTNINHKINCCHHSCTVSKLKVVAFPQSRVCSERFLKLGFLQSHLFTKKLLTKMSIFITMSFSDMEVILLLSDKNFNYLG